MQNIITYMTTLVADQGWNMLALGWFIIAVRGYQTYAIGASKRKDSLAGEATVAKSFSPSNGLSRLK